MAETMRAVLLTVLFAFIMSIQINLDTDKTATRQMKNAAELAVHDASLALDSNRLVEGNIVFDQKKAKQSIQESLKYHLELDESLKPLKNSLYQKNITIEHLEFIDDSNASFPYKYTNSRYDIVDNLQGPSVIMVISTDSPRYFAGDSIKIRQASVYEYK